VIIPSRTAKTLGRACTYINVVGMKGRRRRRRGGEGGGGKKGLLI